LNKGERIKQETRLWNDATQTTHSMRSKEEAHDYRYFPEPDLVPLVIDKKWVEDVRRELPELPEARRGRYISDHGLSAEDAYILAESKEMADFFDASLKLGTPAKQASNFLLGPTNAYLKEAQKEFTDTKITPENMRDLVEAVSSGKLNSTSAKTVLVELLEKPSSVSSVIEQKGLSQVSDESELAAVVDKVLAANPSQVAEFKAGKSKVRQFLFGETMKLLKGKGNPAVINKLLDEKLAQ
jgi:aspartyl-tRNA(Asn)/glutamyl-tRNA(Gln) amidotransferase subunit B